MSSKEEIGGQAPTAAIETLVVVRPLKALSVVLAMFAMLLLVMSIGATTWLGANRTREGLWEKCRYLENNTDLVDCNISLDRVSEWLHACRALCMIAFILTFTGIIVTSVGLRSDNFRFKYRYYTAGMVIWFAAVGFQLISLVTFPIKFIQEIEAKAEAHWEFGWAYVVGWLAAVTVFTSALLLLIDKGADELVYKEVTIKKEGFEEEVTEDV